MLYFIIAIISNVIIMLWPRLFFAILFTGVLRAIENHPEILHYLFVKGATLCSI